MLTTTRVSLGTALGPVELSAVLSAPVSSLPLTQYSWASAKSCFAFSSPTAPRIASAACWRDSSALRAVAVGDGETDGDGLALLELVGVSVTQAAALMSSSATITPSDK